MENSNKRTIIGVQFSSAGKLHFFDTGGLELKLHDMVVVEGEKGHIIGTVIVPPEEKNANEVATNIKKVLKKAEKEDIEDQKKSREEAMKAFHTCQQKVITHGLPMKLVDVDMLAGDNKAIFYFTAEERVDFRGLVKDLASTLHMRIEMRQIGARDAAKNIGAIGSCGLTCCCVTHLREFRSISIQMAKNQGLSPNPAKLTGMCGKLKCCVAYENELYSEFKKCLPRIGAEVKTPRGIGFVTNLDVPRKLVDVRVEDETVRMTIDQIEVIDKRRKGRSRDEKDDEGNHNDVPEK